MANARYSFRVTWSDEDDSYIATCPEFDGVSGFGDTQEDALSEAQTSLDLAIEEYEASGMQLPEPERYAQFSGQFRLRLPASLHARLAQRASDEGMSLNSYAACLIAAGVGSAAARTELRSEISELLFDLRRELAQGVHGAATLATSSVNTSAISPFQSVIVAGNNFVQSRPSWPN